MMKLEKYSQHTAITKGRRSKHTLRDYSTSDSVKIDTQLMNERMDLDPTFIKILKNEIGSQ